MIAAGLATLLLALGCSAPGGAAAAAATPASSAGLQFDQLREFVFDAEPLPAPEAFEQHYAFALHALQQRAPPSAADELAARATRLAEMTSGRVEQQLRGLLSGALSGLLAANPIADAIASRVLQGALGAIDDARREARGARDAQDAAQRLRRTLNARPLLRVSVAGEQLRIDNPAEGSAVIATPRAGRYVVLDLRAKTFKRLDAPPEPPTPADSICSDPPAASQPLGRRDINGIAADGFRDDDAAGHDVGDAGFVTTYYLSDIQLPLPLLALLDGAEACTDDPMAGRLMVYSATRSMRDGAEARAPGEFDVVFWRGHLQALDDPQRFTIPDDFRPVH